MIVIPAIDVLEHKVVQLVGGVPGSQQIIIEDPFEVAMGWVKKGAPYLHLVDLDAAFGKPDNSDVFCRIIRNAARYLTGEAQWGVTSGYAQTTNNYTTNAPVSFEGATFSIREEQDAYALAQEIAGIIKRQQAGKGIRR